MTTHHARVFVGEYPESVPSDNPDFLLVNVERFGIDDARVIRLAQTRSSLGGGPRRVLIRTKAMTREAQNALLKTFEEPAAATEFTLVVPTLAFLLPTLLSRCEVREGRVESENGEAGAKFLAATPARRLETIASWGGEVDDHTTARREALALLSALEAHFEPRLGADSSATRSLEAIARTRHYCYDTSANVKLLCEYLAVTLSP